MNGKDGDRLSIKPGESYYSNFFKYNNGILLCENIVVNEIKTWLKDYGLSRVSPVFVYSKGQIETNVNSYQNALKKLKRKTKLNYAVKANMNPNLVRIMKTLGCSLTLVSGFELELAIKLGFEPEDIVLNGNGKELWEIELAIASGCMLNIDSFFNVKQTIEICKRLKKQTRVLLRVNPNIDAHVHRYNCTGRSGSKFGIQTEYLASVLAEIRLEPLIQLVGIHCHLGSTITDLNIFRASVEVMLAIYRHLKSEDFEHMQCINIGGGLGIDHTKHASVTSASPADDTISEHGVPCAADLVQVVDEVLGEEDVSLILEPGRSLIGNACVLLTTVLGVKEDEPTSYIVVDGAMTEVIRPALYGAYHHIDLAEPSKCKDNRQRMIYDVVGPVCESGDFLGKDRYLSRPHEGCTMAVFDVGAYCASMSSNYNMRARPAEVLISGDKIEVIRRPDTLEDILAPYN